MNPDETVDLTELSDILRKEHAVPAAHEETVYAVLRKVIPGKFANVSDRDFVEHPLTRVSAAMLLYEMSSSNPHLCRFAVEIARGRWTEDADTSLETYIAMCAKGEVEKIESFYKRIAGIQNPPSRIRYSTVPGRVTE